MAISGLSTWIYATSHARWVDGSSDTQVNAVLAMPGLAVTGHEDRHVRFLSLSDGKCVHAMLGHQDAVASLDAECDGQTLVSGGKISLFLYFVKFDVYSVCVPSDTLILSLYSSNNLAEQDMIRV